MNRKFAEIGGVRLALSNLEKNLYPSYGFTKAHILEYYRRIAPFMLPHLKDRALTLKRYPEGVDKEYFFEKRCPSHRPSWVPTAEILLDDGEQMTVCLVNDLNTLMWIGNLASLELHVPLVRVRSPETPDSMVFDLDPGDEADILDCAGVALILRHLLSSMNLTTYVKTSGMKGLHVYVPLNSEETTFEETRKFSKAVAEVLQRNYPGLVTARMAKEYRKKKVFINWSQNDSSKTMVCVYSLRAREMPMVSFPLSWEALENLTASGEGGNIHVTHTEALARAEKEGDLFQGMITVKQELPYL
ncbi:MAG: putative DNA ligase-like protein [Syntrophorhabdus sp. PtaU1.Bin153]|nr:MAG: putative DNA ligase-like protein [Syntrophorhabdus sp. PtaU1.Bin153]